MGWWEDFTDTLGFTNHAEDAASHEQSDALLAAGQLQALEIQKGREELKNYYQTGLEDLRNAYYGSAGALQAGSRDASAALQNEIRKAQEGVKNYLKAGQGIAESYYQPYRRGLDVLTGVVQGTPEETQRLVQGSPLYQWQMQQAQTALDRSMRAKGLGSSRFGMKAQADLAAEMGAKEQDRRISQLMDLYRQGGALGTTMGQAYTGAGGKIADMGVQLAQGLSGNRMTEATNAANLGFDYGKLRSGSLQDLGTSVAGSYGAQGLAQGQAYAAAAAARAGADSFRPSALDNALKIYQAGSGTWW